MPNDPTHPEESDWRNRLLRTRRRRVVVETFAWALVIGLAALVLYPVYLLGAEAVDRNKEAERLKQLAQATINYTEENNNVMPSVVCDRDGKRLLSWRVTILPRIGQEKLYREFRLDEPWDGPNNSRLIPLMPKVYAHPHDPDGAARGLTHYRAFTGPHTPFPDPVAPFPPGRSPCRYPGNFYDGTSTTILIVDAAEAVPWTQPDEFPYDPDKPLPKLGGRFRGGFSAATADGEVHFVKTSTEEKTLRKAIKIDDGDGPSSDW
jgi:hypothetical protein